MKKAAGLCLAISIAISSFSGSAAAATPLESAVDGLIGTKYKYGGTTANGFDCSGFTQYVFEKFNVDLARQSGSQAKQGVKVDRSELRPGDLVFFNTNGRSISHVGIYLGNGEFAHASSKHGVRINKLDERYYKQRYVTARRVLGSELYASIATEAQAAKAAAVAGTEPPQEDTDVLDPIALATEEALLAAEEAEEAGVPTDEPAVFEALSTALSANPPSTH